MEVTDRKFKVIPPGGCHRRIRHERLLGKFSGGRLTYSGLAGFPTRLTLHPGTSGCARTGTAHRESCYLYIPFASANFPAGCARTVHDTGTLDRPPIEGPHVADKSPRQSMTKKTAGKSLKEKRADKRAKSDGTATDNVLNTKHR